MPYNPAIYNRRSIRLRGYDYSQAGLYFITICCYNRECLFGNVVNGEMVLNEYGTIARNEWFNTPNIRKNVELDVFVIMPNHMHGIIILNGVTGRGELHSPNNVITDNKITDNKMCDNIITGIKMGECNFPNNVIGDIKMGDNIITDIKTGDNIITDIKMGDNIITDIKMGDNIITDIKMGDNIITGIKMGDNIITGIKTGDNIITGIKMGDNIITGIKMGECNFPNNEIGDIKMGDNIITGIKMGDNIITDIKTGDNIIADIKMGDNIITDIKMGDNIITDIKMGECNSPLRGPSNNIGAIVRGYKSSVTKQFNLLNNGCTVWQRNYYEHIIRNEKSYQTIAEYIVNNPSKWNEDKFYIK